MPRRPRIMLPNVPVHIIQRGNNRQICFAGDEDYRRYLDWLEEYAAKAGCHIHTYVLMTNHVHLLLTADKLDSAGQMMSYPALLNPMSCTIGWLKTCPLASWLIVNCSATVWNPDWWIRFARSRVQMWCWETLGLART